ncbi:hypothetical protein CMI47_17650 [Candidatus Pacearchaeota archaeon]|nr:hypothetical protein [Candidatus Pacearchaeota archaeon]|tara:strand:- start:14846 stop:15139 length:294 start_codon:yes stop_codon:yes gene_type:complete
MTDLDTSQGHEGRIYTAKDVREIIRLRDRFEGIMGGFRPCLCVPDGNNAYPTREGIGYVEEYRENLRKYEEIFTGEITELGDLIKGMERILNERSEV